MNKTNNRIFPPETVTVGLHMNLTIGDFSVPHCQNKASQTEESGWPLSLIDLFLTLSTYLTPECPLQFHLGHSVGFRKRKCFV